MKINETSCHKSALLTPICTKSSVGWDFTPDPTGGAYTSPQTPLLYLGGLVLKGGGRGGKGKERKGSGGEGERRVGRGEKERGGEGVRPLPYRKKKEKLAPTDWPIHN